MARRRHLLLLLLLVPQLARAEGPRLEIQEQGLGPGGAQDLLWTADPDNPAYAVFDVLGAHEIAWRGRKLVGSAQVRARGGFLQHGSIPRRLDAARLPAVMGEPVAADRFTDLSHALGRVPTFEEIDAALIAGFEEVFGARFVEDGLSPAEGKIAGELSSQGQAQTAVEAMEGSLSVS